MVFAVSPGPLFPALSSEAVLYGLCLIGVLLLAFHGSKPDRGISAILGATWAAMAIAFYVEIFEPAKWLTWVGLPILAGGSALFFVEGLFRGRLDFRARTGPEPVVGALFLVHALIVEPILSDFLIPDPFGLPRLGLHYDPALFTFGILLFLRERFPRRVLVFPL